LMKFTQPNSVSAGTTKPIGPLPVRDVFKFGATVSAGVGIVTFASNGGPDNVDGIESIVLWVCRLTGEVCGTFTGNIDLRMIDELSQNLLLD
jgi:hypothetical protein